jgi:hypothetical protein
MTQKFKELLGLTNVYMHVKAHRSPKDIETVLEEYIAKNK